MYIEHPRIRERTLEARAYQMNIGKVCLASSTLVVLPTGMGKTVIALTTVAERVGDGKVLFVAPTKPLVEQHHRFLTDHLILDGVEKFTGETSPSKRAAIWRDAHVVVATPQVIENDLANNRMTLEDVSLVVFDEAHRAVGNYAYVFIAQSYRTAKPGGLVLGMTASPGNNMDSILNVCRNLGIVWIEARTENDPDVLPYVHRIRIDWVRVKVPEAMKKVVAELNVIFEEQVKKLHGWGLLPKGRRPSVRILLSVNDTIRHRMAQGRSHSLYQAATVQAIAIKVNHAMDLAETQGMEALRSYMTKLEEEAAGRKGSKATRTLVRHPSFAAAKALLSVEMEHPKMEALAKTVNRQLAEKPDSRIIVFTHYRDTAENVTAMLNADASICAVRFVGQASHGDDRGLSQRRQVEILDKFKAGEYNVLVATSVAEEGLDIPSTELVVFYEPVPSEIRTIQRRGRTGRRKVGRVVILISGGTRDEAYYWSSNRKERNMRAEIDRIRKMLRDGTIDDTSKVGTAIAPPAEDPRDAGDDDDLDESGADEGRDPALERAGMATPIDILGRMGNEMPTDGEAGEDEGGTECGEEQVTLDRYAVDLRIIADMREFRSPVTREVSRHGILVEGKMLEAGDYIVSTRVAVERKTAEDLAASIIDGRLFQQVKDLASAYPTPVIIVEGPVFSTRVPENVLLGALASMLIDFRIPVLNTATPEETARLLIAMARREAKAGRGSSVRPGRVSRDPEDMRQYVVEGLPNVSGVLAKRLLDHFGSVRAVMNASEEELQAVQGIGKVKAKAIIDTVDGEWRG
ncbi:MAG: DEAD/DEAH box helicase [Thermoplasmata archaeon]|nr:DEAD/DEAH box helicase [Thermoplasmata archaeon]